MVGYGRPFEEQVSFFKRKLDLPAERYDSIQRSAHDHAFMVAGAMQADLMADLRAAVDQAIEKGTGLAQFRKDFDAAVGKAGWEYNGLRNWRTQVIYLTNLRTSYAAGRYAQLSDPDARAARPLWRYVHSDTVLYPREQHQAWDGLILDATDAWWSTHYPPNGWGCQCTVQAIAKDELPDFNKEQPDDPPTDSLDTRGIDDGWDYAPGQAALQTAALAETKITALLSRDAAIAREYAAHLMRDGSFEAWHRDLADRIDSFSAETSAFTGKDAEEQKIDFLVNKIAPRFGQYEGKDGKEGEKKRLLSWPIATLNPDAQDWLGTQSRLVNFSMETAIKQAVKRGKNIGVKEYIGVQALLDNAAVVVNDRDAHLAFFAQQGKYYKAAIKLATKQKSVEEIYLVTFHEVKVADINKAKKKGRVIRDLL